MMFGKESVVRLLHAGKPERSKPKFMASRRPELKTLVMKQQSSELGFGSVAWFAGYSAVPAGRASGTIDSSCSMRFRSAQDHTALELKQERDFLHEEAPA